MVSLVLSMEAPNGVELLFAGLESFEFIGVVYNVRSQDGPILTLMRQMCNEVHAVSTLILTVIPTTKDATLIEVLSLFISLGDRSPNLIGLELAIAILKDLLPFLLIESRMIEVVSSKLVGGKIEVRVPCLREF